MMPKFFIKPIFLFFISSLILISTACNFKERIVDDEDDTATTTEISITRIDGTIEEFKFTTPLELDNIGSNPLAFAMKDLNNDEREDLVLLNNAADEEDQEIRILLRTSTDTSENPQELYETVKVVKTDTDNRPQHLIVEDMNSDGIQDILVANPESDSISLWEGQLIDGNFSLSDTSTDIQVGEYPIFVAANTFENSGKIGVAIASLTSDDITILLDYTTEDKIILEEAQGVGNNPLQIVTGDWNNDNCPDLASLSEEEERVDIFRNLPCPADGSNSNENPTFEKINGIEVGENPQGMIVGDWDQDGQLDIAVSNKNDDDLSLLYGAGDGNFERWDIRVGDGPGQLAFADFNKDGVEDFVVGNLFDQDLSVVLSIGDGKRPGENQKAYVQKHIASGSILAGNRPAFIKIIDINNDGKLDILTTLPFEEKLSFLLQK